MAERENVVDFTVPYYDLVGITILMKKPKAATSLFKFLTVLENDVWLCILAAYFFTRCKYSRDGIHPCVSENIQNIAKC
jgi:ionotropic glutamate receptor